FALGRGVGPDGDLPGDADAPHPVGGALGVVRARECGDDPLLVRAFHAVHVPRTPHVMYSGRATDGPAVVFSQVMDLATDLDGAFPDFVRRNQDAVYSVARRLTQGRDDAEDAAQEAFVRAYRALAGWDAARRRSLHEGPWLAAIALNVCRNQARTRRRR